MSEVTVPAVGAETDAGDTIGSYVRDGLGRWHASVALNGQQHATACLVTLLPEQVAEVVVEATEVDGVVCDGCLGQLDVDEPEVVADGGVTENPSGERVQWFYKDDHADGTVWVGQRGRTAIKAADFADDGNLWPLAFDPERVEKELETGALTSVERAEVPDEVVEYLEEQFRLRAEKIDALRTDGGLPDDSSMRCFDCERVFDRRHVSLVEVPVENEDRPGYEFVPVPLCRDCRLRRYGVPCDNCDGYHWDHEGVFECKRDRPSLVPDGGVKSGDREQDRRRFLYASLMRHIGGSPQLEDGQLVGFHGKCDEKEIIHEVHDGEVFGVRFDRVELFEFDRRMSDQDIHEWFVENDPFEEFRDDTEATGREQGAEAR